MYGAEASPTGGSCRGDPAFRVTGEGPNATAEISFFFLENLSKTYSPCVCKIKCVKIDKNKALAEGFFRGHGQLLQLIEYTARNGPNGPKCQNKQTETELE